MDIFKALPAAKFADAARHSRTPEFQQKRDRAIQDIRAWSRDSCINHQHLPGVKMGYGKDGCATAILFKLAGVKCTLLTILNGGDLPIHEEFGYEFDAWFGDHEHVFYETEYRYVDYLVMAKDWGLTNGLTKKNGDPIDYWDMGDEMDAWVNWEVNKRFDNEYAPDAQDILLCWGNRAAEEMWKFYEFQRRDNKTLFRVAEKGNLPYWDGQPLASWRDRDVWALLISENAPVSPIYSYHDIPQRIGKNAFPRTLWYPAPFLMNATYYKWLARYAPALLQELGELFPELPAKMKRKSPQ